MPTILSTLAPEFDSEQFQNASYFSKAKQIFSHFVSSTQDKARNIGISVSQTVYETINGAYHFICRLCPQFTSLFTNLRDLLISSAQHIISSVESLLTYFSPSAWKSTILAYVCLLLILLAISIPSSSLSMTGRVCIAIMTGVIYYSQSLALTATTGFFLIILSKMAPLANLNIDVKNKFSHELQWDEKEVREDSVALLKNILSVAVLFSAASTGIEVPTDEHSWDKLMKRHVLLHRSFQAWEFGTTKIVELFESSARVVCKYIYGTEYTSMNFIQEVDTLILEVIDLCTLKNQFEIGKDEEMSLKIELLYTQYLQLRKIYANDPKVMNRLNAISSPITAYFRRVSNKNPRANAMRKEPVVIAIKGGTGLGKTYLATAFQQDLLKICGKYRATEDLSGQIYARNIEQEFWDGYVGQPIVVFDDFGQHVDSINNPNDEYFEIIRAANIFPYMLHSAELAEKANNPFKADFIYLTTNDLAFKPVSIISKEAFQRRIHIDVTMHILEEVGTYPESGSNRCEQDLRLDRVKLAAYKAANGLDESDFSHIYFKGNGTTTYSYEELICLIGEQYRINVEEYKGRQRMAEIKRDQKLPAGCFSTDPQWVLQSDSLRMTSSTFFNQPKYIQKRIIQTGWSIYNSRAHTIGACEEYEELLAKAAANPVPDHIIANAKLVPPPLLSGIIFGKPPLGDNTEFELRSRYATFLAREFTPLPLEYEDHFEEIEEAFEHGVDLPVFEESPEYWNELYNNVPKYVYYEKFVRYRAVTWYQKLTRALGQRNIDRFTKFLRLVAGLVSIFSLFSVTKNLFAQQDIFSTKQMSERPIWNFYHRLTAGSKAEMAQLAFVFLSKMPTQEKAKQIAAMTATTLCIKVCGLALYIKDMLTHLLIHPESLSTCSKCKGYEQFRECSSEDDGTPLEELKKKTFSQLESLADDDGILEISKENLEESTLESIEKSLHRKRNLEGNMHRYSKMGDIPAALFSEFLKNCDELECKDCEHGYCLGDDDDCPHPKDCEKFNTHFRYYGRHLGRHVHWIKHHVNNYCDPPVAQNCMTDYDMNEHSPSMFHDLKWKHQEKPEHTELESPTRVQSRPKQTLESPTRTQARQRVKLESQQQPELQGEVVVDPMVKRIFKLESGRAYDSEKKKKFLLEGLISDQADLLATKAMGNFWRANAKVGEYRKSVGNIFVLRGRKALINIHFMERISNYWSENNDMTLLFKQHGKEAEIETNIDCILGAKPVYRGFNQTEFMMFELPKEFPNCVDFTKHLIKSKDLSKLKMGVRCLLARPEEVNGKLAFKTKEGAFQEFTTTIVEDLTDPTKSHTYVGAAEYDIATDKGDCGSPIFLNSNMFERKLLGFHYSGRPGAGSASVICYEDIAEMVKDELSAAEPKLSVLQADEEMLPQITCRINGYVKDPVTHPCSTALRRSPIFECLGPSEVLPSVLEPALREDGPMLRGFAKYSLKKCKRLNPVFREAAKNDYFKTCVQNKKVQGWERSILSYEEACQGIEGNMYFAPLKRSKSSGYPYMLTQKKGKEGFFGKTDWDFSSQDCVELFKDCQRLEEQAKHGIVPEVIFVATLKDEKRSLAKIATKSTRVFSASPLHFTIVFRKYFAGFFSFTMRNKIRNECGVGTNVHSSDWTDIRKHLKVDTVDKLLAGDFANFDGDLLADIMDDILSVINEFYGDDFALVRKCLWECITHSKQLIHHIVLELFNGQPSGNPGTAIINSIYVSLLFRINFYTIRNSVNIPFSSVCKIITYGDDHILSVHPHFANLYSPYDISRTMELMGHGYTDAFKNKITPTYEWSEMEDVVFLKRSFVSDGHHDYFYAPLELKSIREMINWIHKSPSDIDALICNVEGAFRELCHHDHGIFEKYTDVVRNAISKLGHSVLKPNYHLLRWQLRSGDFEQYVQFAPWV